MNKVTLSTISGAIGLAIGVVGTYIFLNKKYEDAYYKNLQKAIDEECERLRAKHGETALKSSTDTDEPKIFERENTVVDTQGDNPYQERLKALEPTSDETKEPPETFQGPRFIDEDEYRFLPPKYEIRELQYLSGDGTVLDENDEVVEEPQIYISGLEETLKKMSHFETAYILVESIGVACEVVVLNMRYEDVYTT